MKSGVSRRLRPPYSRHVSRMRAQHGGVSIIIFASHMRWERAQKRNLACTWDCGLVLPEDASPADFTWPVHGCEVVAVLDCRSTRESALRFGNVLHEDGAVMSVLIYGDSERGSLYVYDKERAAA